MSCSVVLAASFRRDLSRQRRFHLAEGNFEFVDRIREELRFASALISESPHAGVPEKDGSIRKLVLGKLPFVIWYRIDDDGQRALFLRLFHFRQRRQR